MLLFMIVIFTAIFRGIYIYIYSYIHTHIYIQYICFIGIFLFTFTFQYVVNVSSIFSMYKYHKHYSEFRVTHRSMYMYINNIVKQSPSYFLRFLCMILKNCSQGIRYVALPRYKSSHKGTDL